MAAVTVVTRSAGANSAGADLDCQKPCRLKSKLNRNFSCCEFVSGRSFARSRPAAKLSEIEPEMTLEKKIELLCRDPLGLQSLEDWKDGHSQRTTHGTSVPIAAVIGYLESLNRRSLESWSMQPGICVTWRSGSLRCNLATSILVVV